MATATAKRNARSSRASRNGKPRTITLKNMIDGKQVAPADGKREDVLNPATGEVIAKAPLSSKRDVDNAVKAAKSAFVEVIGTAPGMLATQ